MNDHMNILYERQFGFRPRSGTENAALEITNKIMQTIDKGKFASAVFMDLKKAFDVVSHKLLL
jgi:retron-type reverse transcriptase